MSDSVRPQRGEPTRLPRPWDSPGKNTGVGCHFLLQCMKVKSESEVAQSCPTLSDPMDCSLPGSSAHGIFQARILEWGAIAFSACCTWLTPNPLFPHFPPSHLFLPICWGVNRSVNISFHRCPSARSQTWADSASLKPCSFSLGTILASIPGNETSNQVWGTSQVTYPL